jgi:hypothetical protein
MGLLSSLSCAVPAIGNNSSNIEGLWLLLTAVLNVLLASMITWKLVRARRALLKTGLVDSSAQYITTISIVVESSLVWVLSIILFLFSDVAAPGYFQALEPFFQQVAQIMPVSIYFYRTATSFSDAHSLR